MPHKETVAALVQLSYQKPLVITFVAEWMGSSFILETYLRELANQKDELEFSFFDSDEHNKLAAYFDVNEIPTTLYLDKGEIRGRFSQLMSKRRIEKWLDDHNKKKSRNPGHQTRESVLPPSSILAQLPPKPAELTNTRRIGRDVHLPTITGGGSANTFPK